jgi:hypothetical protein
MSRAIVGFLLGTLTAWMLLAMVLGAWESVSPPPPGTWGPTVGLVLGGPVLALVAGLVAAVLGAKRRYPAWLTPRVAWSVFAAETLLVLGIVLGAMGGL